MNFYYFIISFFILLNLFIVINFSRIKFFHLNIDKPDNKRKFHTKPTALAGGQIIFFNILIYWLILIFFDELLEKEIFFQNIYSMNYFFLITSLIFLIGFIDDRINLKANHKFVIIFFILILFLLLDQNIVINKIQFSFIDRGFSLGQFNIFFTVFCFLVYLNAFNMFDGINLQSSFYSLFIFLNIMFFFTNSLLITILVISLIGFSYLNFKNKTFLGDSGSLILAFIISYFFISLYNLKYIDNADKICLFMIIPGFDLIRLFVIRIFNKKNPLNSDRNHFHHILIAKYSLEKTLFIILSLISFPVILDYLTVNVIYSITLTFFIYSLLIYQKKK
tara:strand:+ start:1990 stop:2994 length:1005 start_codon:yes stop_codon:yes gene_type:complete